MHNTIKVWPLTLLVLGAPAGAQVPTAPPVPAPAPPVLVTPTSPQEMAITVDELVQHALDKNPQLPIARQAEEAARQRLGAARSFPSPTLELVPRLAGNREVADEEIILSQPLDLFGRRRARTSVAGAELRAAQAQSTLAERTLVVSVKNAAANLFAAQEAESLGEVQVEVAQAFRGAAARRAELGDVPQVQVQRADLELLRVQNELTSSQAERLARRAVLNQLVGQAPETPLRVSLPLFSGLTDVLRIIPLPQSSGNVAMVPSVGAGPEEGTASSMTAPDTRGLTAAAPAGPDVLGGHSPANGGVGIVGASAQASGDLLASRGQILGQALSNRPDILSAQATLEARRGQAEVLRRERLPNIEVQARRSTFTGTGSTALRAVVTVPIFDFGSNKRERRALEAEARAQESQIELLRSQVGSQVEQALIRLQQQQQTVARYRTGIVPLTLDLLRKTQIGYAQGASTYLEVLEAQRTLRQVQTEYLQALVGTRTQEAALESALGSTPSAEMLGPITNPTGAATPPGVAAPGTLPQGTIPSNPVAPLNPQSPEARQ